MDVGISFRIFCDGGEKKCVNFVIDFDSKIMVVA